VLLLQKDEATKPSISGRTVNRFLLGVLLICVPVTTAAQDTQAQYDSASAAWDRGDYPDALRRLERVLRSADGSRFLAPAALLTGELYSTTEIAPDGRSLRWNSDGRHFLFETGTGPLRATQIFQIRAGTATRMATLARSTGAVFSPAGQHLAFLAVAEDTTQPARIFSLDLDTGGQNDVDTRGVSPSGVAWNPATKQVLILSGRPGDPSGTQIHQVKAAGPTPITEGPGIKGNVVPLARGSVLYTIDRDRFALYDAATQRTTTFTGVTPSASANGEAVVFVGRNGEENTINLLRPGSDPTVVRSTRSAVANPALSADGKRVVFQMMPVHDWELYVVASDGTGERRITNEIQHDVLPRFLNDNQILYLIGEPRHRRSYMYDLTTAQRTRLHHNNTVRTVAPEYEWAAAPDGSKLLIVADRDGNTISPERGVYLMDLTRTVTLDQVITRIQNGLAGELDLRARGERTFAPFKAAVQDATKAVSTAKITEYATALFGFGSKFITQPGNRKAIDYLVTTLRSWGYDPEVQEFEPRPGIRSANVIATLRGTTDPELIYVASSHFDSVERGPGADDNSSGTTALLEAARVMKSRPQPVTIKFAWFTGEEAGLLGSREFVRRAVAAKDKIVGALNNDMLGFMNDSRMDNTIRYSNDGIRDIQHAAAMQFTKLITYDARYYRGTDAHAYYEVYGDIVGGIGSYPILGNPHYHQATDALETISQPLVAEVSKTTLATLMLLASSPARLTDVKVQRAGAGATVTWSPALESSVQRYIVAYGPPAESLRSRLEVNGTSASLPTIAAGDVVSVKAVNAAGSEGWDWARAAVR
jgi:Tol biopolymer transport system component